jgi:hypothetical protein
VQSDCYVESLSTNWPLGFLKIEMATVFLHRALLYRDRRVIDLLIVLHHFEL